MTMKKFFGMMTALVMTAMSFTSCYDEDVDTSITLSGDWEGDFGMYYEYFDRYGKYVGTYDCYDSDVSFYPNYDYATHGYGYQVDYYDRGPYRKIYHSFNWEIRNGRIYLDYRGENEYNTVIRDYRMNNSYFEGYFGDSNERFRLAKYADYYDWDPYWSDFGRDGWGYYYYDSWYYYTTRADEGVAADSVEVKPITKDLEGGTIRMGNRFSAQK